MADKEHDVSWAIKLLTPQPEYEQSVLGQYGGAIGGTFLGFVTAIYVNFGSRRPIWSGIHKHVAFTAIGGALGRFFELRRARITADRDATFRHYISLHPEDFPEPAREKFADILIPWIPVR